MENLNTIKEDFLRWTKFCVGCGQAKPQGMIVCHDCYHHPQHPYKSYGGKIEMWLCIKYGIDYLE